MDTYVASRVDNNFEPICMCAILWFKAKYLKNALDSHELQLYVTQR